MLDTLLTPERWRHRERSYQRCRKKTTKRLQQNYIDGRLGLIIDGTGKDYDKITTKQDNLKR